VSVSALIYRIIGHWSFNRNI